jgi:hypothetical protein
MRVNRTLLYAGIFLVAIGGVVVAVDLGVVDEQNLADALGLWPLAVITLGIGLVLRRTRASLSGGMLAAAVPGLLLGSAFAVAPRFAELCGGGDSPAGVVARQGTFDGPASVSVTTDCGSLIATTAPGSGWQLDVQDGGDRLPNVDASTRSLAIASTGHTWWPNAGRDRWDLTLPTSAIDLSVGVNAGRGDIDLSGAQIGQLSVSGNASDVFVDASTASVTSLTGKVNFGALSIRLPTGDLSGSLRVNAGMVKVCAPPELGLLVISKGDAEEVRVAGVHQDGSAWQSANYTSAEHRADLLVHVDLGAVEINPIGGCR